MSTSHACIGGVCAALQLSIAPLTAAAAPVAVGDPVFDIPALDGVVIDGQADEWRGAGLHVQAFHYRGDPGAVSNFLPACRIAWDTAGLLVCVEVQDDVHVETPLADALWQRDSVELFVSDGCGATNRYQVVAAPGTNAAPGAAARSQVYDRRTAPARAAPLQPELSGVLGADGYTLEARLPWAALGQRADAGTEMALQVAVNDSDGGDRVRSGWHSGDAAADLRSVQRIRLAQRASPPVTVALSVDCDAQTGLRVDVVAAGRTNAAVTVSDSGRVLGTGLLAGSSLRSTARVLVPLPPPGAAYGALEVDIGDVSAGSAPMPDLAAVRRSALERVVLRGRTVFSGTRFPAFEMEDAYWIQSLVGPCQITPRYLDAGYHEVARADQPGRYGAILTVTPVVGEAVTRRLTLFRQPADVNWRTSDWSSVSVNLPAGLGIPDAVVSRQHAALGETLKWRFASALDKEPDAAILLAGLHETAPDALPATRRNDVWHRDQAWWYAYDSLHGRRGYAHRVCLPREYDREPDRRWPLMLFLHGAGERGADLAMVDRHGPPRQYAAGTNLPFIVVAPQCPAGTWWLPEALGDLLDDTAARLRIDTNQVFCTGLSMGGFGTWATAATYPERFAAIVPICGGGDLAEAALIRAVPTWVFHGGRDSVVPTELSTRMVEALRAAGGEPRYTIYPEAGHDSWTAAYNTPELYTWLLAQRRR